MSALTKALVALLFVALLALGFPAPAAHASGSVEVTLKVTTKTGSLLPGMRVLAAPVQNHAIVGEYIEADLISNSYRLHLDPALSYAFFFDAPSSSTTAFDQWWGGTTFVEESKYWSSSDGTNLTVTLATNSTITGKVTGVAGRVLSGITVFPWRWDGNDWYRIDNAKATTTSTGVYTMRNLEPGSYRLEFAPSNLTGYLSEFSGNSTVFGSAATLTLGLGATVSHNAALVVGGSISGKVQLTDAGLGGNVLSYGVTARAYPVDAGGNLIVPVTSYSSRETGDDGKWTISGLPSGRYKVKTYDTLDDEGVPAYVDLWVPNAAHITDASVTVFTVTAGKATSAPTTTMPFYQDRPDTSLVLNVKGNDGNFTGPNTEVLITSADGEDFSQYFTLSGGTTYFPFVPTGSYNVYVDPKDGVNAPYVGTQSIGSGAPNTWNINLALTSSYTYATPATIAETASTVGTTYVVNPGHTSFVDSKVTFSYIWLRGDTPIFGSQSVLANSYTSRGADLDKTISVIVRADTFGYDPVFWTVVATNTATQAPAPTVIVAPTVTGTPAPRAVLTAGAGTWNSTGLVYSYQWKKNGASIAGATARTYVVKEDDADSNISVEVTATKPGYGVGSSESSPQVVNRLSAPKLTRASKFVVAGISGGVKVTASSGTWSPTPTSYTYAWKVGGVTQPATGSVLTCTIPSCENAGLAIEVTVTAHRTGSLDASRSYVVRKGTTLERETAGFVYDFTDGGHPSLDARTDPAYATHTLTVSDPEYDYPGGDPGTKTVSYLWQRKIGSTWYTIKGATKSTHVVTASDMRRELRVRVVTTSTLYPKKTDYLIAGTGTLLQDLVAAPGTAHLNGTDDVGTVKWASVTGWPVTGVKHTYRWYTCKPMSASACTGDPSSNTDWKAISKATASSYKPVVEQYLIVRVVGSKANYQSKIVYSAALHVAGSDSVAYTSTGAATISGGIVGGTAAVGRQLTGKPGALDRTTGVIRTSQWQICEGQFGTCDDVLGATGPTATPTFEWFEPYADPWVRFTETVSYGTTTLDGVSTRYELVEGVNTALTVPKVSVSGTDYTLTQGWSDSTVSCQWYDGSSLIKSDDCTGTASAPAGTTPVYVAIHVTRDGYNPIDLLVPARKGSLPVTAITGTTYGSALNATVTSALGLPVTARYQWYLRSTAIRGATKATFVPSTAYIGKALKVRITVSSAFYNTFVYYTPTIVLGSHPAATGAPVIVEPGTGSRPGARLSVNLTSFPGGMSYLYSWQRSVDAGAHWAVVSTASTYTLTAADANAQVRVVVVARRSGWVNSAAIPSAPVSVGYSPALALTSPFVLGGTGKVDGTLTAATAWNTTGYALSYSWTRNGVTIPGATGATVTPTASWFGDEVQAHVTATKPGYQPVTVHSNEVKVVEAAAPTTGALVVPNVLVLQTLTVSTPVWNVAGLTVRYAWYDEVEDPGHASPLSTTQSVQALHEHPYTVVVTASRAGYATATVSKTVTPTSSS